MEQYRIERWDHLFADSPNGAPEQYVPPEVEEIGRNVMGFYSMNVNNMTLITSKPDKGGAIWKIDTDKGPRSLKVLHRTPSRSLFSMAAQDYLVGQGARVPSLIPTIDGQLSVEAGGKLWIVTEWIEALVPASKVDLQGAKQLCGGLGEFHRISKGFIPPLEAANASRLYKWPQYYEKIFTKIGWYKDVAEVYNEFDSSRELLSVINRFSNQAKDAMNRLQSSSYFKMIAKGETHWGLVHQDYGWSNGQMGPGGIWIIDLDGVAYDIPIRDLRKLITSTMDDMGVWDTVWIRGMIDAYHQMNPIDVETFELLLIDMALPNEFYKHLKDILSSPELFLGMELPLILPRLMGTEDSKWKALAELQADVSKYESGQYEEISITQPTMQFDRQFSHATLPLEMTNSIGAQRVDGVSLQPDSDPTQIVEPTQGTNSIENVMMYVKKRRRSKKISMRIKRKKRLKSRSSRRIKMRSGIKKKKIFKFKRKKINPIKARKLKRVTAKLKKKKGKRNSPKSKCKLIRPRRKPIIRKRINSSLRKGRHVS